MADWEHFRDGSYCHKSSKGRIELSKNISSGSECMALGSTNLKSYVSFMIEPNNDKSGSHCFGYDSCVSYTPNSNYKTYARRSPLGNF